jgi:EAL domain-containing protein (putative c-di-GMP-specific phosphodiesterase class I)
MDDFGAGHSSLTYLIKRFRMDELKIDRSFVNDLAENPENKVILSGITNLAQALGLEVVAEGIETAEQLRQLREIGCNMGQGYYLARPLPAKEAGALLD